MADLSAEFGAAYLSSGTIPWPPVLAQLPRGASTTLAAAAIAMCLRMQGKRRSDPSILKSRLDQSQGRLFLFLNVLVSES